MPITLVLPLGRASSRLNKEKSTGGSLTCVPCVVAGGPGQVPGEGVGQVEDGPGQDDDVIEVQQSHNDLCGVAHSCSKDKGEHCVMAPPVTRGRLRPFLETLTTLRCVQFTHCDFPEEVFSIVLCRTVNCFLRVSLRLSVCWFFKCTVILRLPFLSEVLCLSLTTDSLSGLFSAPVSNLTTSPTPSHLLLHASWW